MNCTTYELLDSVDSKSVVVLEDNATGWNCNGGTVMSDDGDVDVTKDYIHSCMSKLDRTVSLTTVYVSEKYLLHIISIG